MWSVGCVAAFLYIGTHMYPGKKEYETVIDHITFPIEVRRHRLFLITGLFLILVSVLSLQIKYIMETQGPFPEDILVSGEKTGDFFHRDNKTSSWRLKATSFYSEF